MNVTKQGVRFAEAATVVMDPLAVTVFDAAHSQDEDRWFTLGTSSGGRPLAVAHTFVPAGQDSALVRIIYGVPDASGSAPLDPANKGPVMGLSTER